MSWFNLPGKIEGYTDGNKLNISVGNKKQHRIVLTENEVCNFAVMIKGVANDLLKGHEERKRPAKFGHLKISSELKGPVYRVSCNVTDGDTDSGYKFNVYLQEDPYPFDNDKFQISGYVYPPQWNRGCYKYDRLKPAFSTGCGPFPKELLGSKNLIEYAAMKMVKNYIFLFGHDMQFNDIHRRNPFDFE